MIDHMSTERLPAAVLWDFDGTLVDTEPLWIRAELEFLASRGVEWTYEQAVELCGSAWQIACGALAEAVGDAPHTAYDLHLSQTADVTRMLRELTDFPWRSGAQELLHELGEAEIPLALVSASSMELLNAGLDRIGAHRFHTIIDGDSVNVGKPHPEGYLLAAERLGVAIEDCIIIEDSINGTVAGREAGALVIGVPDQSPLDELPNQKVIESLAEINLEWLRQAMRTFRGL